MKNLRGALFVLLVVFTAGTERASFVLSAPQEDPDVVIPDDGIPDVVIPDDGIPDVGIPDVGGDPGVIVDDNPCAEESDGEQIDGVEPEVEIPDGDGVVEWADLANLLITEIMYNPPEAPPGSPDADQALEYIELLNIGEFPVDLCGVRLSSTNGMRFVFPAGTVVAPEQRALVVKNLEAFTSIYDPCEDFVLAGEFTGSLGDDGDDIFLADRLETMIVSLTYSDRWYPPTDGDGSALQLFVEPIPQEHYGKIGVWTDDLPTPGCPRIPPEVGLRLQLPGDSNQDASLDISDAIVLFGHLFGGTARALPCEGTSVNYGGNLILLDVNGDYTVNVIDVMYILNALFGRGYPPVRGLECIDTPGCEENTECPESLPPP